MDTNFTNELPTKTKIKETYETYVPYLTAIMQNIETKLQQNIRLSSQPTYKARVKSFDSYYKKILHVKPHEAAKSDELVSLTDMIGIRVICAFLEDLSVVLGELRPLFKIKEIEKKGASQNFREFGYESIHVLVAIPDDCIPRSESFSGLTLPADTVCEIQIRTILQDAWAEVEHELIYKSEFSPFDLPLRRKLASMNASLSLADIIFQEIRDYQKKLQGEMEERRRSFYEKADELDSLKPETLPSGAAKIERVSPYVKGTIDDMLLEAIHAHNTGDLEKAVRIYTQIIESKPKPDKTVLAVIHKHRGMAFFAQSEYEKSLADFKASEEVDKTNFRAIYYEGIVYSILKKNSEAIACYTRSLELNEYQSHAFYRRALAYYDIHDYGRAMQDITAAQKLGLNSDACRALHDKLVAQFDMNV
ncbi:MAG TPA: (p)ppGpp synthetase [Treponema sp.]|nr:(p)ppGpp synthetase [Treponema sp.]